MTDAATARAHVLASDVLELAMDLSATTAIVLWLWVLITTIGEPELCSSTPALLSHCPLCYPAAFATLVALVSGGLLLRRRFSA